MPQITGADDRAGFKLEISTNGTTWTDVSGAANTVVPEGWEKQTGETYTADGDNAIITTGKSQPGTITAAIVYTEGSGDAFEILRPIFEAGSDAYVRYSPRGGGVGTFMFTPGAGKLTTLVYPSGDAASGDPLMTGFTWRGPRPVKSVVV